MYGSQHFLGLIHYLLTEFNSNLGCILRGLTRYVIFENKCNYRIILVGHLLYMNLVVQMVLI